MAATYEPAADHPFLSQRAQELFTDDPTALPVYADAAEQVLAITEDDTFSGEEAERATNAVARQISVLVEWEPAAALLTSESRGSRSKSYREVMMPVDPVANLIVGQLKRKLHGHAVWAMATSVRGRNQRSRLVRLPMDLNR